MAQQDKPGVEQPAAGWQTSGVGHPRRWAILAVLVTSLLVVVLDNTILNIALPTIQRDLNADQSQLVWAVDSYILVFAALRLLGASLSQGIRSMPVLGALDRSIGLGFGLLRAFIFLGACNLAFNAATPVSLRPAWLEDSKLYPLTEVAGTLLKTIAPKGLDAAGQLKPAFTRAVLDGSVNPQRDSGDSSGYDARSRGGIDDLVEKAR